MPTRLVFTGGIGVLGLVIGVVATSLVSRPEPPPRVKASAPANGPARQPGEPALPVVSIGPLGPARDAAGTEAIRAVVREEIAAALAGSRHPGAGEEDGSSPGSADPAVEPSAAYEQARLQVAERIARGMWVREDRDRLRAALDDMSDSERDAVVLQVLVAMNSGALQVSVDGPPF